MDSLNLATLFAPNLMHSFNDDLSKGNCPMFLNSDRMDHVSALKRLVDKILPFNKKFEGWNMINPVWIEEHRAFTLTEIVNEGMLVVRSRQSGKIQKARD